MLGGQAPSSSAAEFDFGLMAELGAAITRGVSETRAHFQEPTDTAHNVHVDRPVLGTAPQTPETASLPSPIPLATATRITSVVGYIA